MAAKWEKTGANVGVLEVEVDSERFAQALDEAFKRVVKRVVVPGFRKGKVPRKLFEKRFGVESLYEDAVNILLPQAYQEAVIETGIEPVDQPAVDVVQVESGKPFIFKATVTVKPEVQLGEYKGVEVEDKVFEVTDQDVEQEIENVLRSHAQIETVEDGAVEKGDVVTIDFEGTVDGEPFEGGEAEGFRLEIGSGALVAGFEDQLIGMKPGEEREIEVTFPENYHVKSLRGKVARFRVKLHEIRRPVLRELNDEFVQEISEFQTVDEYMADLRKKLEERAKLEHERYIENEVVRKAIERATIEIPPVMIEREIDHQIGHFAQQLQMQQIPLDAYLEFTGLTMEELRDQYRELAEQNVRTSLVLEAIANAEQVEITEEDVEQEIARMAEQTGLEADRVRQLLSFRDPELASFRADLKTRKTVRLLVDHAKIVPPTDN